MRELGDHSALARQPTLVGPGVENWRETPMQESLDSVSRSFGKRAPALGSQQPRVRGRDGDRAASSAPDYSAAPDQVMGAWDVLQPCWQHSESADSLWDQGPSREALLQAGEPCAKGRRALYIGRTGKRGLASDLLSSPSPRHALGLGWSGWHWRVDRRALFAACAVGHGPRCR